MRSRKAVIVAEIVGLLLLLAVIEWLSTVFLNTTRAFWPLMIYVALYLCVRAVLFARKLRTSPKAEPRKRSLDAAQP